MWSIGRVFSNESEELCLFAGNESEERLFAMTELVIIFPVPPPSPLSPVHEGSAATLTAAFVVGNVRYSYHRFRNSYCSLGEAGLGRIHDYCGNMHYELHAVQVPAATVNECEFRNSGSAECHDYDGLLECC